MIKTIEQSTKTMLAHPRRLCYAALLDILFLIIYGIMSGMLVDPASLALTKVLGTFSETIELSTLLGNRDFFVFIGWIGLQFFLTYALFCFFEGSACYHTHRALKHKASYKTYLERFAYATRPWFVLFILYQGLALARDYAVEQGGELALFTLGLDIYLAILIFIAGLHYKLIIKETTIGHVFATLHKEYKTLVPLALALILLTFVVELAVRQMPQSGLPGLLTYALVIAYFTWARGVWLS